MRAIFNHTSKIAHDIQTFYFQLEQPLRYEPGQFVELYLPHKSTDARGERREFSLSSSPNEPLIAITTNFASNRGSSYKRTLQNLQVGEAVTINEPMGDFVLPKDTSIPLVFVAIGTGCTPYASMVKWLIARAEHRSIQLIYSASSPSDFIFSDLWRSYPLDFIPIVNRTTVDWEGRTGRLDETRLLSLIGSTQDKLIYLAGPQSSIEPLFNDLLRVGIPRAQLLLDYFPGY